MNIFVLSVAKEGPHQLCGVGRRVNLFTFKQCTGFVWETAENCRIAIRDLAIGA